MKINIKQIFNLKYLILAVSVFVGLVALALVLFDQNSMVRWILSIYCGGLALYMMSGMVRNILRGRIGVDILAVIAIASTIVVGEYWASFVIVIMAQVGVALESYASNRAKQELTALMERAPKKARVKRGDEVVTIAISDIVIGDRVVVSPGDVVPVDCEVVEGESSIDESSLTGESVPVEVRIGAKIMSGTVNIDDPIEATALATAADSQYSQIIELVKAAGDTRAPFVRLADRYAVPFTLVALTIAGIAWVISGDSKRFAEVLVVATPCPLILAAPIAMISGMSRAAKHGIILKSGAVLEQLSRIRTAAFDKTGTLTMNELSFDGIVTTGRVSEEDLLKIAAAAEQGSSHMTAIAILKEAKKRNIQQVALNDFQEVPGKGIRAMIGEHVILAGRLDYLTSENIDVRLGASDGKTATHIACDGQYLGCITFADTVRSNSATVLASLRQAGVENLIMLTGDYKQTAERIAEQLGITEVHAECLPKDKLEIVQSISARPVMMVGDGVNDAPVLAASDVGVAMGARGATAASESADAVIMLDDISRVSLVVQIAKRAIMIAKQSVYVGIGLSIVLMLVASAGLLPAVLGATLQELVDLVVIVNALRAHRGATFGIRQA